MSKFKWGSWLVKGMAGPLCYPAQVDEPTSSSQWDGRLAHEYDILPYLALPHTRR